MFRRINFNIAIVLVLSNSLVLINCEVLISKSDPVRIRNFSITDFISNHGYPVEVHKNIQTKDGYLLDVHRIPHGRTNGNGKRPAILLMHGLLGSSENWIVLGPEKGLAFMLADKGYDVWMANARGNVHSRKHVNLNPDRDAKYWQFSWQEIAVYDLPALIKYILRITNQNKLSYVGHSQGTTVFFAMTSDLPEYNKYIKIMVALAPVVFMSLAPVPGNSYATLYQRSLNALMNNMGTNELKPSTTNSVCMQFGLNNYCINPLTYAGDYNSNSVDPDVSRLIKKTFPAGASRQVLHYNQEFLTGQFAHFDFGPTLNSARYNSIQPPSYNLNKVSSPVALFYARRDTLAPPQNVEKLSKRLPKVVLKYLVPSQTFNHLDFVTSKDVKNLVYGNVLSIIQKYN